jgi:hypothetical protein
MDHVGESGVASGYFFMSFKQALSIERASGPQIRADHDRDHSTSRRFDRKPHGTILAEFNRLVDVDVSKLQE